MNFLIRTSEGGSGNSHFITLDNINGLVEAANYLSSVLWVMTDYKQIVFTAQIVSIIELPIKP